MKKICLVFLCLLVLKVTYSQPGPRRAIFEDSALWREATAGPRLTIYEDSALMREVIEELTSSLSNRGYYIPIYTRGDSMMDAKLTLSPAIFLLRNYRKRNDISDVDFLELLPSCILDKKVLEDICPDDFEKLYGRDRILERSIAFICDSQPRDFLRFIESIDVDTLIAWAFNSKGYYRRSLKLLPIVAERLLLYGILLNPGQGVETISRHDIDKLRKFYQYYQSHYCPDKVD